MGEEFVEKYLPEMTLQVPEMAVLVPFGAFGVP